MLPYWIDDNLAKVIIKIENLVKKFGDLVAVNNVTLDVNEGEIFGLLGPNGAGKTTIINVLLSLLKPTSGKITVDGLDLGKYGEKIKQTMGLMTQETVTESDLTARQSLEIFAELYHIKEGEIKRKVDLALADADLVKFADVRAGTFSGGMQRRLGIVKALLHAPKILVLDEPTTGLDVQNRSSMWKRIKELNKTGTTIILTTQYLEEADELCDRLGIIDHGKIIALGTPSEIKKLAGQGRVLEMVLKLEDVSKIAAMLKSRFGLNPIVKGEKITAALDYKDSERIFTKISSALDKEGVTVLSIGIHLPTLDDVFMKLTGSGMRDATGTAKSSFDRMMWK